MLINEFFKNPCLSAITASFPEKFLFLPKSNQDADTKFA